MSVWSDFDFVRDESPNLLSGECKSDFQCLGPMREGKMGSISLFSTWYVDFE